MRKRLSLVLATVLTMGSAVVLQAGEPVPQTKLEQLQAIVSAEADASSAAIQAIAQFLQLKPDQIQTLVGLLQARSAALTPVLQQLDQKGKQLDKLLESGGAAADVGQLV